MIKFRQKEFGKKISIDKIKAGVSIPISVAGLGVSTFNAVTNAKRKKQDKKFQDAQVEATEKLARAIIEESSRKDTTKKAAKIYKKSVNNTVSNKNNNLVFRLKNI